MGSNLRAPCNRSAHLPFYNPAPPCLPPPRTPLCLPGTNAADGLFYNSSAPGGSSWEQQLVAGGNGDGSLTYPGRPSEIGGSTFVPVASLRLKHIRDGLEDMEYMLLLEELLGSRVAALQIVDGIVRTAYDFEHEAGPMLAAREALADRIEAALASPVD